MSFGFEGLIEYYLPRNSLYNSSRTLHNECTFSPRYITHHILEFKSSDVSLHVLLRRHRQSQSSAVNDNTKQEMKLKSVACSTYYVMRLFANERYRQILLHSLQFNYVFILFYLSTLTYNYSLRIYKLRSEKQTLFLVTILLLLQRSCTSNLATHAGKS
jgi:hypothetical protein